jgi:exodeoxyribonuclease VII small subunit
VHFAVIVNWTPPVSCFTLFPVPNPTKGAGHNSPAKNLPFEEALKKLEGIVEAMESDELPLEALMARYEEGTRLVKICQEKLAEAELKIQQLEKNAAGELKLKPLPLDSSET